MAEQPRHVVIAGGSSGIGLAIARAFVAAGDRVTLLARDAGRLRSAADALGPAAAWRRADVASRQDVAAALSGMAGIDVLVNAAGGFGRSVSLATESDRAEDNWDAVIAANLKGSFLLVHAAAPLLASPGGCVINISSIVGQAGTTRPGGLAYSAAKAGLHGLTFALAQELAPRGITANVIAPGLVADTEFTGTWPEDRIAQVVSLIPLGRAGRTSDVAGAALWLASEPGSFVTGAVIPVNGGWRIG